jgi:hypothetical protein
MFELMIKCRITGCPIPTGLQTERTAFDLLPEIKMSSRCFLCDSAHHWTKHEAWLERPVRRDTERGLLTRMWRWLELDARPC